MICTILQSLYMVSYFTISKSTSLTKYKLCRCKFVHVFTIKQYTITDHSRRGEGYARKSKMV